MRPTDHPFDELPLDLQAEVRDVMARVQAGVGDVRHRPGGSVHAGAEHLAATLFVALRADWRSCATSDQLRARLDTVAAARAELDEVTDHARQALETAADLLGGLLDLVEAEERRRAEVTAAEARRRQVDAEIDRLAAREDAQTEAERRQRLEAQATHHLADRGS